MMAKFRSFIPTARMVNSLHCPSNVMPEGSGSSQASRVPGEGVGDGVAVASGVAVGVGVAVAAGVGVAGGVGVAWLPGIVMLLTWPRLM